jgi:Pentapeptide repeats (8 copies)
VFAIATFPGEWAEEKLRLPLPIQSLRLALVAGDVDIDAQKPKSLWSNRLVLPGLDVIDHTKLDEAKIAALPQTASLRARHLEGAVLIGAGLRKVDFTAAHLENARLDGADLRSASLNHALLRGVSLDPLKRAPLRLS